MSKCTNNISSSTNIVDHTLLNDIEKQLTTADDGDATSTRSEEDTNSEKKCTSCEQNLHTKTNDIGAKLEHTKMNDIVNNNIKTP